MFSPRHLTATSHRAHTAGAVCWILTVIYFAVQPLVAAAWDPPYSFTANTISDLGNATCGPAESWRPGMYVCSPRRLLMNIIFAVTGALIVAGAYLLRGFWPRRRVTAWGLAFIALSGAGAVLVGAAPADVNLAVHAIGALLQVPGAIGPLLLGLATTDRHALRTFSIVAGVTGTVASLLFLAGVYFGLGMGTMERLGFDPLTIWMITIGVVVVSSSVRTQRRFSNLP